MDPVSLMRARHRDSSTEHQTTFENYPFLHMGRWTLPEIKSLTPNLKADRRWQKWEPKHGWLSTLPPLLR